MALTSSNSSPLPVELTAFTATPKNQAVSLSWTTASEKNNDHFDIQRSATGATFETIGTVKGQGNATSAHEYAYLDGQALSGQSYYRLRQVDIDGTAVFSPVVAVERLSGPAEASVYPNPTAGTVTLPASAGAVRYRVFNALGQTLLSGQAGGGEQLDITKLTKGAFFLELTTAAGRTTQRLVRE